MEVQVTYISIKTRLAGVFGQDLIAYFKQKFDLMIADVKAEVDLAIATCYQRGTLSDCAALCSDTSQAGGVHPCDLQASPCHLWLPTDFLQKPAAGAAAAGLFALKQTKFLDKISDWLNDELDGAEKDLSAALSQMASQASSIAEALQNVACVLEDIFTSRTSDHDFDQSRISEY